eukprot:SAG11_NODE_17449_length_518_cov_1.355609_1_plen_64_part_00
MDEEQRRHLWENGYLIIKGAISAETVAFLNEKFEAQLAEEKPPCVAAPFSRRSIAPSPALSPR